MISNGTLADISDCFSKIKLWLDEVVVDDDVDNGELDDVPVVIVVVNEVVEPADATAAAAATACKLESKFELPPLPPVAPLPLLSKDSVIFWLINWWIVEVIKLCANEATLVAVDNESEVVELRSVVFAIGLIILYGIDVWPTDDAEMEE